MNGHYFFGSDNALYHPSSSTAMTTAMAAAPFDASIEAATLDMEKNRLVTVFVLRPYSLSATKTIHSSMYAERCAGLWGSHKNAVCRNIVLI